MPRFRIGESAQLLGVSDDTLRRWIDDGRLSAGPDDQGRQTVDGADLARLATEMAEDTTRPTDRPIVKESARNRFTGLVTRVVRDAVMAQVEIQSGPHRIVSLMSRESADELGSSRHARRRRRQGHQCRRGGLCMSRIRAVVAAVIVGVLSTGMLAACSSSNNSSGGSSGNGTNGTIQVFAAASLTEVFTDLGKQFETDHPGTKVVFQFAASSALATNINEGDKADVFASAAPSNMQAVVDAGNASDPKTFAKNEMETAVPPGNPGNVNSLDDLAKPSVKVAVCQPQVPWARPRCRCSRTPRSPSSPSPSNRT